MFSEKTFATLGKIWCVLFLLGLVLGIVGYFLELSLTRRAAALDAMP